MSDAMYSHARAKATADTVRACWPCQGVSVHPHPTVDRWVRISFGWNRWENMVAADAIAKKRELRLKQREARKGKRRG